MPTNQARVRFEDAVALHQRGQLAEAAAIYREIVRQHPQHFDALRLLATTHAQRGELTEAEELFGQALALNPTHASTLYNRGSILLMLARPAEALKCFDGVLAAAPDDLAVLTNRGNALRDLGRLDEALASYDRALSTQPGLFEALYNRANTLTAMGRYEAALAGYDRALAANPNDADALSNRGIALRDLKRPGQALESYDRALRIAPDAPEVWYNRGNALMDLKRPDAALESYERALRSKPEYADALCNRGNALTELRRQGDALASFDRALAAAPEHTQALCNRGNALRELARYDEALESYGRALAIRPDYAEALINRGHTLRDLKRTAEAFADYDRARAINPDADLLHGHWLNAKMAMCDWRGLDQDIARVVARIEAGKLAASPFSVLAMTGDPAVHQRAAEIFAAALHPAVDDLPTISKRPRRDVIRLGYFSTDFRNHPVGQLIAGVIEEHDRARFYVTAFSIGPDAHDAMRTRLRGAFDEFIDVRGISDRAVAEMCREREIDIAIDLNGYTDGSRTSLFAHRAAPVQVNYLGYPGTMNASYIDYLVADKILIPAESRGHYGEKIAYLPNTYQANDAKRQISDAKLTRAGFGLPEGAFVFCCFNNSFKILPETFDSWMRLLDRIDGSVLWLLEDNAGAAGNLGKEAESRGVSGDRLIFAGRAPLPEHLARHKLADLFLDTLPYNAHTTASDALWAGLPVLTCMGHGFASRVCGSLLSAAGLPELITDSQAAYEDRALALAKDPGALAAIRQKLARNRLTMPLFDTRLTTRHLEAAYVAMHTRRQAQLLPDIIEVAGD